MHKSFGLTTTLRTVTAGTQPELFEMPKGRGWDDLTLARLSQAHAEEIVDLRAQVLSVLDDPDEYVQEEDELGFIRTHLGAGGFTLGVFSGATLVGYGMVGFPRADDPENMGRLIGVPEHELGQVAHIASCMVVPEWRGRGLQKLLLEKRIAIAGLIKSRTQYIAMTSLRNARSRHNMLSMGFRVRKAMYIGTLRRHLLHRYIDTGVARPAVIVDRHRIEVTGTLAFEQHRELTERGWWGISEQRVNGLLGPDGSVWDGAQVLVFHPVRLQADDLADR